MARLWLTKLMINVFFFVVNDVPSKHVAVLFIDQLCKKNLQVSCKYSFNGISTLDRTTVIVLAGPNIKRVPGVYRNCIV